MEAPNWTIRRSRKASRSGRGRSAFAALTALHLLVMAGCDGLDQLLAVNLPGDVVASDLDNPALARTLVLSAQGDFECGYAQHVLFTGFWAEEVWNTGGGLASAYWSLRTPGAALHAAKCVGGGEGPTWTPLQVSRVQAEGALSRIDGWSAAGITIPNEAALRARAHLYAAYSYQLLSETFCSVAFDAGPLQSREAGFKLAESHFSNALEYAGRAAVPDLLNAALVGRARSRLNLGDGPGAVADASLVPAGFTYFATYDGSPVRRQNHVATTFAGRGISTPEQFKNLQVGGKPDPRVVTFASNRIAGDGVTAHWDQSKYRSAGSGILLASWREAQLMIAEAEGGQAAVGIINVLRSTHGLPAFSSSNPQEIVAQLREERRRELWLQGTRMADMLRWNEPFRSGVDQRGRSISNGTCAPIPDRERFGNPNID